MTADTKEMAADVLDTVVGGNLADGPGYLNSCKHEHKEKTGAQREDYRYIIWSKHQFEYYCEDCGKKIWIDEEP